MRPAVVWRTRASPRMASYEMPATTGTSAICSAMRTGTGSTPSGAKTMTLTSATTTRKPVPQRGCRRLAGRTLATSTVAPDSRQLIALCSAPWYSNSRRTLRSRPMSAR